MKILYFNFLFYTISESTNSSKFKKIFFHTFVNTLYLIAEKMLIKGFKDYETKELSCISPFGWISEVPKHIQLSHVIRQCCSASNYYSSTFESWRTYWVLSQAILITLKCFLKINVIDVIKCLQYVKDFFTYVNALSNLIFVVFIKRNVWKETNQHILY